MDDCEVTSLISVITILEKDAKKIHAIFYVMKRLLNSLYWGCELDRTCPRCNQVEHGIATPSLQSNYKRTRSPTRTTRPGNKAKYGGMQKEREEAAGLMETNHCRF
ncbi:hypothetical protein ACJMK2_039288 [Sinanodonta woodiana]|uniref:Uncharacterized protein n=1 Tax=Sinanodonta woodiana TaxID=1069815 RepID=A0ABD3WBI6_SINWO